MAYIWLSTFKASSLRFMASKNFGVSGINVNTMALNKLIDEVHVRKKRHGLYSTDKILKLQSIGMIPRAIGDIITQTPDNAILTNAAAWAAVVDVWNSLMYE